MTHAPADRIRQANHVLLVEGDLARLDEFFTEHFVAHGTEATLDGLGALRRFLAGLHAAFTDWEVEVTIHAEAGDRIAWERTVRATHKAKLGGFPPSGRMLTWRDMIVSRFEHGMIAEDWAVTDLVEGLVRARK